MIIDKPLADEHEMRVADRQPKSALPLALSES